MRASVKQHIQQLPTQLANQIAAGEVVERPASVVKELLENSIDANATRIDIDIEQGGLQSIRVQDDGEGIFEQELPLALSRHATSKVSSLFDLEHLVSLGFRGEALPSIASVSRLQITSRRHDAARGSRIEVNEEGEVSAVSPAAHPPGTTVVVDDLFCSVPARRRFLRAVKTEFSHIQDVVLRIALARPDVSIQLRHNNRQVIKLQAASDESRYQERIARVFGQDFLAAAFNMLDEVDGLRIKGLLAPAHLHRAQTDRQFVFINGRVIKDRVLSHAIRQGYADDLPEGRFACYCLYMDIDPELVDVNVHPTKHEVRFRDGRNVHDFLFSSVQRTLRGGTAASQAEPMIQHASMPVASEINERAPVYTMPVRKAVVSTDTTHPFGEVLTVIASRFLLCKKDTQHWLIDTEKLLEEVYQQRLASEYAGDGIVSRPLLVPERVKCATDEWSRLEQRVEAINQFGFELSMMSDTTVLLRRAPVVLQQANARALVEKLLLLPEDSMTETMTALASVAAQTTLLPESPRSVHAWLATLLSSVPQVAQASWLRELDASRLAHLFIGLES